MSATPLVSREMQEQATERAILVVDRDDVARIASVSILRRIGFEVIEAASGKDALCRVRAGSFSLAILDLNLAEMSAFDLCRRLLAHQGWAWTPVIFTSARRSQLDLEVGMQAAGFGYLPKPFRSAPLMAAVGDALASGLELVRTRPDRAGALNRTESASRS